METSGYVPVIVRVLTPCAVNHGCSLEALRGEVPVLSVTRIVSLFLLHRIMNVSSAEMPQSIAISSASGLTPGLFYSVTVRNLPRRQERRDLIAIRRVGVDTGLKDESLDAANFRTITNLSMQAD